MFNYKPVQSYGPSITSFTFGGLSFAKSIYNQNLPNKLVIMDHYKSLVRKMGYSAYEHIPSLHDIFTFDQMYGKF